MLIVRARAWNDKVFGGNGDKRRPFMQWLMVLKRKKYEKPDKKVSFLFFANKILLF